MNIVQLNGQTRCNVNTDTKTVGTTVVQISTFNNQLKWGVQIVADASNTNGVWVGVKPNLSAGTAGTSGFKLEPGASILVPAEKESGVYCISDGADQVISYLSF